MRSLNALARAELRQQRREQRELTRAMKEAEKEERHREAATEVAVYEATLAALNSVHKECGPVMHWSEIVSWPSPDAPRRPNSEAVARAELEKYRPGLFARLFGGAKRTTTLLEAKVDEARENDARSFEQIMREHREVCLQLERLQRLGDRIIEGDADAYAQVFEEIDSFEELQALGIELRPRSIPDRKDALAVDVLVEEKQVVPSSTKTVTKTGKLSSRAMAKNRIAEIYQDYVCGAALRIGREVFAALPIKFVLVTCWTPLLDESTGVSKRTPVLAIIASRTAFKSFNFDALDPSVAMSNLKARMAFKRGEGMRAIDPFAPSDVPAA